MANTVALALPAWTGRLALTGIVGHVGTVDLVMPAPSTVFDPDYGIVGLAGPIGAADLAWLPLGWPHAGLAASGTVDDLNDITVALTCLTPAVAAEGWTGVAGGVALALPADVAVAGATGAIGAVTLTLAAPTLAVFAPDSTALALPAPELAVVGASGLVGGALLAMPAPSLAVAGDVPFVATVALSLVPRVSVLGATGAGARLSLAVPAPRLAVHGATGINGFVALSAAPPRLVTAGYEAHVGALALAWPAPQLTVAGRESVGATFATLAMHTETLALSTYQNYPFNAFARFNGVFLGASAAGVFALTGGLDAGAPIASVVRLGKLDFSTAHSKRIERCYVGYRADGDLALQAQTDDGATASYALAANGIAALHGARVVLAKGAAGRYWQFSLANTDGADFSLDAFEAAPLVLARRVRSA